MQQCADTTEERIEWEGLSFLPVGKIWECESVCVSVRVCARARECVRVCVCVGRSERGWKTHMNKREDKSFSCFSNILIFHECLFDVVLNIHVFYA